MLNQDAIDALKDLGEHISAARADAVKSFHINMDELVVMAERDHIVGLLRFLREDPQCDFETLIDICGVDYPERGERFEVVYHLLSMHLNHRVRVRVSTDEDTAVPSACAVWPAANWFEREVFDMFGIRFRNHPDLRRILLWKDFPAHPLRKDYPLRGRGEREFYSVLDRDAR